MITLIGILCALCVRAALPGGASQFRDGEAALCGLAAVYLSLAWVH